MKNKILKFLALLIISSMFLAACGGGSAPDELSAEEPMAEEVIVTIGFTSSSTGKQEVSSKRQVNGFSLWMEQVNETGGVTLSDGTLVKFDFVTYDDEFNPERVQELYTRLISVDNADFLISPYSARELIKSEHVREAYLSL